MRYWVSQKKTTIHQHTIKIGMSSNSNKKRSNPSLSSHKLQESIKTAMIEKKIDSIDKTPANRLEDDNDKKRAYDIIKHVTIETKAKCNVKPIASPIAHGCAYYTLRFRLEHATRGMRTFTNLVQAFPLAIRNIIVKWPKSHKNSLGVSVHVQVFHYWVISNPEGLPAKMDSAKNAPMLPTSLDIPKYTFNQYTDTFTKAQLLEKKKKNIPDATVDTIPTWAEDVDLLHNITHDIYNMDKFIPQLSLNVTVSPNRHSYGLVFSFMESINYAFIEYLLERYPRIMNIDFTSFGTTTRTMGITITYNPERSEKVSPVYVKRFSSPQATHKEDRESHGENNPKKQKIQ
jgi:hypothetical protein